MMGAVDFSEFCASDNCSSARQIKPVNGEMSWLYDVIHYVLLSYC